jgi:hypothetical protein
MTNFSLYEKTFTYDGIYVMFFINRFQMLYLFLIMPMYLIEPYMFWVIIGIGLLSQLNLIILSKCIDSNYFSKGYQGFQQLFGVKFVRFLSFIGLILLLNKLVFILLGYVEIVQQFIFPSTNSNWLALFIFLMCVFVASHGMEKTVRFVVISFFCTFWMIFLFGSFFLPPIASLYDVYPIIPTDWSASSWKGVLLICSAFSGPEYLIFLSLWLKPRKKVLRYLSYGNLLTTLEYSFLFIAALFFYGSAYLSKSKFPVVNMARYLQFPVLERIDMILISGQLFNAVFAISILLLFFYGAVRIGIGRIQVQTTRTGFLSCCLFILLCIIFSYEWIWKSEINQNILLNIQLWVGSITYFLIPVLLLVTIKLKERV